jgi:hypothetical protein
MSDFARLAGQQCPPQEALALELAIELGVGDAGAARGQHQRRGGALR